MKIKIENYILTGYVLEIYLPNGEITQLCGVEDIETAKINKEALEYVFKNLNKAHVSSSANVLRLGEGCLTECSKFAQILMAAFAKPLLPAGRFI